MTISVAEYIANFLVEKGVRYAFGYQGSAVAKIINEVVATGKIEYVQNYHEQGSAFCADGAARINGSLGVAIVTSGPGATNTITGIVDAQLDSVPTLFITGQDYAANVTMDNGSRQNGFQDLDIVSITETITKYSVMLTDPVKVRYELEKAYAYATTGRPGAVVFDVPMDVQFAEIDADELDGYTSVNELPCDLSKLPEVIDLLKKAKRPVILSGGGIRIANATGQLAELVDKSNIPVVTTLNGLDSFVGSYSFAGIHGNTFANLAIQNADVLIVLGARLGTMQVGRKAEGYTEAAIIHVDIDQSQLNRILSEEISICSDLKPFISALNENLDSVELADFSSWHSKIQEWENNYCQTTYVNNIGVDPVVAAKTITSYLSDDAILTADVGQNQMWLAQAFRVRKNQRLLNSSGLGSMGFSLPASIGAKYAKPDAQIVAFMGDGGLQMNLQELMLIGHKQLAIKCIVMNNNTIGMIREVQKRHYKEKYYGSSPEDYACVDLEKLAQAYNICYYKIEEESDVISIKDVLANDKPYIIDMHLAFDSLLSNRFDDSAIFEKELING